MSRGCKTSGCGHLWGAHSMGVGACNRCSCRAFKRLVRRVQGWFDS